MKFIYTACKSDQETLLSLGFTLIRCDTRIPLWIFENSPGQEDVLKDISVAYSDILTF